MNLSFDATDEGVGVDFRLEVAGGEGVVWPSLVFAFFFFAGAFDELASAALALSFLLAMMAGR